MRRTPFFFHLHRNFPRNFTWHLKKSVTPVSKIESSVSDHCAGKKGNVVFFNMMMQCKKHNNGFGMVENTEYYRTRIGTVVQILSTAFEKLDHDQIICLQEACIHYGDRAVMVDWFQKYLPSLYHAVLNGEYTADETNFGVTTFIHKDFHLDETLIRQYHPLENRCRTFYNDSVKLSNIHVPHDTSEKPSLAKSSLQTLLHIIIDDLISGKIKKHDIVGDFNLKPGDIKTCLRTVWSQKVNELKAKGISPIMLTASFSPSKKGHRKRNGEHKTVDGVLSLQITPASWYDKSFRFVSEQMISAIVVLTYMLGNTLTTEDVAAAAIASAAIVPGCHFHPLR